MLISDIIESRKQVFEAFENCKLSVDVVASSDVSVSLTLDRKQQEKGDIPLLLSILGGFADVNVYQDRSIVSIVCNTDRSSEVMALAFRIVQKLDIKVEMLSQGASKVNIGMVIPMKDKERLMMALHACFFENKSVEELI